MGDGFSGGRSSNTEALELFMEDAMGGVGREARTICYSFKDIYYTHPKLGTPALGMPPKGESNSLNHSWPHF